MTTIDGNYHAYLLRFWRESELSSWRASLQDARTGQTLGFASMDELYQFLDERAPREAKGQPPEKRST